MHLSPAKHIACDHQENCDYTRHTDERTDAGQSDPYVPVCFAGETKMKSAMKLTTDRHAQMGQYITRFQGIKTCKCKTIFI